MTAPSVSLVMAAYSPDPGWLREAVASALDQSGCSVELIVVDDGSPLPVADSLDRVTDRRLRTLRVEHAGESDARNAGIAESRGRYLRFLDADDVFPRDSTSTLLGLTEGSDDVIACGATRWCEDDLRPLFDWIASMGRDPIRRYLLLRSTPMLPSMLFPRRVVDAVGPWCPGITVGQDWDFILRALEHATVAETRQPMTYYRQHPGSASRNVAEGLRGMVIGANRYFERHPPAARTSLRRQVEAALGLLHAELSDDRVLWQHPRFWRALRRDPSCMHTIWHRLVHPRVQARKMRLRRRLAAP